MSFHRPLKLCAIPGDGIGKEVIPIAVEALQAALPEVRVCWAEAGWETFQRTGNALPDETLSRAKEAGAVLFGATSSPSHKVEGYRSPIVSLRREMDTFANIRPAKRRLPPDNGIDLVIVRENTEGAYSRRERAIGGGAISERVITRSGSERVARVALELARSENRPLTIVHKANVLPMTDGLWREVCLSVAEEFPDVAVDEVLVDAAAYHMVRQPSRFRLLLAPNLYGDILSDLASGLADGLGMAPSVSIGKDLAIAEPVHGSAPDIAGKGIANPIAAILSVVMLVRNWWGIREVADRIEAAVEEVLASGFKTPDIAGAGERSVGTKEMGAAIIERLGS